MQGVVIFLALLLSVNAYIQPRIGAQFGLRLSAPRLAKADLFSDDLFDDEEEVPAKVAKKDAEPPKKKYLEKDWKLSADDQKEFQGFTKKGNSSIPSEPRQAKPYPVFALMYKFRREYFDNKCESALADHKGHCLKFKRLINSEVIKKGKAKGVVLLWAGLSETDKAETKAEITSFIEEDPLILKDYIENWDLVDLQKQEGDKPKPSPLPAGAGPAKYLRKK